MIRRRPTLKKPHKLFRLHWWAYLNTNRVPDTTEILDMCAIQLASPVPNPYEVCTSVVVCFFHVRWFCGRRRYWKTSRQSFFVTKHQAFMAAVVWTSIRSVWNFTKGLPRIKINLAEDAAPTALLVSQRISSRVRANGATKIQSVGKSLRNFLKFCPEFWCKSQNRIWSINEMMNTLRISIGRGSETSLEDDGAKQSPRSIRTANSLESRSNGSKH